MQLDKRLCQLGFRAMFVVLLNKSIALSIQRRFEDSSVSPCANSKSPLAAMEAADESAGHGAGLRGARKSLIFDQSTGNTGRYTVTNQGTIPSCGRLSKKYVANFRAVSKYSGVAVNLYTELHCNRKSIDRNLAQASILLTICESVECPSLSPGPGTIIRVTLGRAFSENLSSRFVVIYNMPC